MSATSHWTHGAPFCYAVPAAEFQHALELLVTLPFIVLFGYLLTHAVVEWPEYVDRFRWHQRRRRIRAIRQARAVVHG